MLNEKRVVTMAKLAMYEKGRKKEYLRISTYHRWDYISFNVIMTLIWSTIGYAVLVAIWGMANYTEILSDISIEHIQELVTVTIWIWIIVLLVSGVIAGIVYFEKYYQAEQETKEYYHALRLLNKMYEKER